MMGGRHLFQRIFLQRRTSKMGAGRVSGRKKKILKWERVLAYLYGNGIAVLGTQKGDIDV